MRNSFKDSPVDHRSNGLSATTNASPEVVAMLDNEAKRITPLRIGFFVVAIAILVLSFRQSEIDFFKLARNSNNMVEYMSAYWPPNFRYWRDDIWQTLITISMGIWGTLFAAVMGVPLSLMASANVCPVWIVQPTRRIMDAMRSVNELIFALIFVVAVGLGPFAGVLALIVHTAGNLGKLFSEAVEAIDPGPVEGIRATGASKYQEIIFGIFPQVLPLWTSFTLYRFEANVRSASVLGFVGAGGIGFTLFQSIRSFDNARACAVLIILITTTSLIDAVSAQIRKKLV